MSSLPPPLPAAQNAASPTEIMRPGLHGRDIITLALDYGHERKVSDLQFRTDCPLYIHTSQGVECIPNFGVLSNSQLFQILEALLDNRSAGSHEFAGNAVTDTATQLRQFEKNMVLDFSSNGLLMPTKGFPSGRLRIQAHLSASGLGITCRVLNDFIPSLDGLGIAPDVCQALRGFALRRAGLGLVTGPTGSGKSTTLASLIDWVRQNAPRHIVTVEDPVEYRYPADMAHPEDPAIRGFAPSVVTQQEVGRDVHSYRQGLKDVLRKAPHIILIGEIRDREAMETCIEAAQTGHFVLSTLHTTGAVRTISRILEFFPKEAHASILKRLAETLLFVHSQGLLIGTKGRVLNYEFFQNTDDAVSSAIANYDGGARGLDDAVRRNGNVEWDKHLKILLQKGLITPETFESVKFRNDDSSVL